MSHHPIPIPTPDEAHALLVDYEPNVLVEWAVMAVEAFGAVDAPVAARLLDLWPRERELSYQQVRTVLAHFVGNPPISADAHQLADAAIVAASRLPVDRGLEVLATAARLLDLPLDDVVERAIAYLVATSHARRAAAKPAEVVEHEERDR